MKLSELNKKFKNKYVVRMVAGTLAVTLAGTSICVYDVNAARGNGAEVQTAGETGAPAQTKAEQMLQEAVSGSFAINEKEIGKEETVYVIADSAGKAQEVIVSDHLINSAHEDTIKDVSTLSNIVNVKGDETFTKKGSSMVWQTGGNDIYYRGTSEKELPITQKITYYLDGGEIKPQDLAGKSGEVTIRFDYTNYGGQKAGNQGNGEEVCAPFVAVSGMILNDSFRNIKVKNGKVVADGNRNIVIGCALPGLKDSLQIKDGDFGRDTQIPEYFEVTADVEDFSLDMTMTAVMNVADFVSAEGIGFSAIDDVLHSMTDATGQLEGGSAQLADGVDTLKSKLGEFASGMNGLADGVSTLRNGAGSLADGAVTLNSSAKAISDGIAALDNTLHTPLTEAEKAAYSAQAAAAVDTNFAVGSDDYNRIYDAAKQSFSDSMNASAGSVYQALRYNADSSDGTLYMALFQAAYAQGLDEAYVGWLQLQGQDPNAMTVEQYAAGRAAFEANAREGIIAQVQPAVEGTLLQLAGNVTSGIALQGADATAAGVVDACKSASRQAAASALVSGIETTKSSIASSIEAVQGNGYSLVTGASALCQGTQSLVDQVPQLVNGVSALSDGAGRLKDGTGAIVDGVGKLGDGAHELADGILTFREDGIEKIVDSYDGDIEPLVERIQAVLEAGKEYQIYTDLADGVNGSVKFIYKTAAIGR